MRLSELEPRFYMHGGEGVTRADGSAIPERHGVGLLCRCPCGCAELLCVGFENPIDGGPPMRSRPDQPVWRRTGETFETLTITPSILRVGGCGWHGWIRDGEIVNA